MSVKVSTGDAAWHTYSWFGKKYRRARFAHIRRKLRTRVHKLKPEIERLSPGLRVTPRSKTFVVGAPGEARIQDQPCISECQRLTLDPNNIARLCKKGAGSKRTADIKQQSPTFQRIRDTLGRQRYCTSHAPGRLVSRVGALVLEHPAHVRLEPLGVLHAERMAGRSKEWAPNVEEEEEDCMAHHRTTRLGSWAREELSTLFVGDNPFAAADRDFRRRAPRP